MAVARCAGIIDSGHAAIRIVNDNSESRASPDPKLTTGIAAKTPVVKATDSLISIVPC